MHGAIEAGRREAKRIVDLEKNSDADIIFQPSIYIVVVAALTVLLITFMCATTAYFLRKKKRQSKVYSISKSMSELSAQQA